MSNPFFTDTNSQHAPAPPRPPRSRNGSINELNVDALRAKESELQRKEAALLLREARLNEREKTITNTAAQIPNWPKCKPLIHHDIEKDIPESGRYIVKRVYFSWWLSVITFVANAIACFAILVSTKADEVSGSGTSFGVALIILIIGVPVSFVFWYRTLYNAVKNDASTSYVFFCFNYLAHIILCIIMAIGIPASGGAGVVVCSASFKVNVGAGALALISTVFWGFLALFCTWQLKTAWSHYRNAGHTLESTRNDAIREVAKSEVGREAIVAAAKSSSTR